VTTDGNAATKRQLVILVLATVGAGVLGLGASVLAFVGLTLADSGLYKPVNPAWGLLAGALGGAITAAPAAWWRKSWAVVALSAGVFALGGAAVAALS
jgi:hypothetical protein